MSHVNPRRVEKAPRRRATTTLVLQRGKRIKGGRQAGLSEGYWRVYDNGYNANDARAHARKKRRMARAERRTAARPTEPTDRNDGGAS